MLISWNDQVHWYKHLYLWTFKDRTMKASINNSGDDPMKNAAFLGAFIAMSLASMGLHADTDYPKQTIKLVVGYGAGGGTDACNRALAIHVGKKLGQSMIVDNKPGAGSSLSVAYITTQKPDGYNIAALSSGAVLNQVLNPQTKYDVVNDLTAIAMVAQYQAGVLVRGDSSYKSFEDVVKASKAGKSFSYSTAGVGTPQHLTSVRLAEKLKADWVHIPYKSGPEAISALLAGDVELMAQTAEWVPYVRDGRLRLIAVYTEDRIKGFESVPTLKELGYDLVAPSILGVVGPAKMPADVVKTLQDAFRLAMQTKEFQDCAENNGLKPDFKDASTFNAFLKTTLVEWTPLLKQFVGK
jgi:tripartite-type tricarboxylate transporter receptor subunit TctC